MKSTTKNIMAPAGNFETLSAAIKAGADSVYFGISKLNMRARGAKNFTIDDLSKIVDICKKTNVLTYLALNIVMYDEDLESMKEICNAAKKANISAVIATDFSTINYAKSIGLRVHLSTQANVSNIEAVKFYSAFCDAIVLARELNINQIKNIVTQIKEQDIRGPSKELVKIEIFVHGALCVSISGKCYMSLATYNHSANRGDCLQPCRRAYKVTDEETGNELKVENKYVMSPKDLCTIEIIDKLIETGATMFKIEGRARKADYVYTTVKVYKEAVKSALTNTFSKEKVKEWTKELQTVYNRGFWQGGYYLGDKLGEWSNCYGSKATATKVHIGKCLNYFSKPKIGLFLVEADELKKGDTIAVIGPTTGFLKQTLTELRVNNKNCNSAKKGQEITIPMKEIVRKNDVLFKIEENN